MTTIAYKQGIVACDKQATDGCTVTGGSFKMVKGEASTYVITGTLTRGVRFTNWLEGGQEGKAPKLKDTIVFEMDNTTGKAQVWEDKVPLPIEDTYWAHGSGGEVALGAMYMGASVEEAIRAATKHDTYTGKGVQVVYSKAAKKRLARG